MLSYIDTSQKNLNILKKANVQPQIMLLTLRFIIGYIFHSNIKADKVTTHNLIGVPKRKLAMYLAGQKEKINYARRVLTFSVKPS